MNKGTARPASRGGSAVIDRAGEPHPGLAQPTEVKWQRTFPGESAQLELMRRWLASLLPDSPALEDVLTVANELATNALQHTLSGQGGWFAVQVTWAPELVRVSVADQGGQSVPALVDDPQGEHGRGLIIMRALSVRTGVAGGSDGRQVWAEIACGPPMPELTLPGELPAGTSAEPATTSALAAATAIAGRLTAAGFGIHNPVWEDAVSLKVTGTRSAFSEVNISAHGLVAWDYHPFDGRHTNPAHLISVVLDLLSPAWEDTSSLRLPIVPDLTLEGMVARALIEAGMRIDRSQPETEQQFFDGITEIVITNPAEPRRGIVRFAGHGAICWECETSEAAGPDGLSTGEIAATITRALWRAVQPCCLM